MLALHHLLHRQRGNDIERHTGIVAFSVTRGAFDHRIVIRHAGLLRSLRDIVDIGSERDDRLALPPRRDKCGGNAGDAAFDLESFLLENSGRGTSTSRIPEILTRRS